MHGYGEYEFDRCINDKSLACGGSGGSGNGGGNGGDGGATKNIISPKFSNFGDIIMYLRTISHHEQFTITVHELFNNLL